MGKWLSTEHLKPGMILSDDVIESDTGAILVPKGATLTVSILEKLDNYNVTSVPIEVDGDTNTDKLLLNAVLTESYNAIEENFENIYSNLKKGEDVDLNHGDIEFKKFSVEISSEKDILTQLQLLKRHDDYTYNHSMGVGVLAAKLGSWLGFDENEIYKLSVAGIYHDIGKVKIDDAIVNKKGSLDEFEYEEMKKHTLYSFDIVKQYSNYNDDILQGIVGHHERLDGTGYPFGLKGEEVSKFARVIAICDVYHAIISNRVYRPKDSPFLAAKVLKELSFGSLDPYYVNVFLENISRFYVGNKVLLSDGSVGIIVYIDPIEKEYPVVKVGDNFIDFKVEKNIKILEITT